VKEVLPASHLLQVLDNRLHPVRPLGMSGTGIVPQVFITMDKADLLHAARSTRKMNRLIL
jgi:hypothetical protein